MFDFGFTDNEKKLLEVQEYREAAVADGWKIEPLYETESVQSAAKLTRDGWVMHVMARDLRKPGRLKGPSYEACVTIWGPDRLQITVPHPYSWHLIEAALSKCMKCGQSAEVERVGFAGRYCKTCSPSERKRQELARWTS